MFILENPRERSEIFEENDRFRNELHEYRGRLSGESGNRESSSSTDPIFGNRGTKSTLLQPQGRSKHIICALEALEAFIRAVCAGKRDFKRSTESRITVTHTAGTELQELYYMLAATEGELKPYKDVIKILDEYFVPKVNVFFERHVFRQMEQQNGEKVNQFVCRLRQKAITCEFTHVDETIRDQLIEKCQDQKLRRKFLEKTNPTLADLQSMARAFEAVNEQMKSMEKSSAHPTGQVNWIKQQKFQNKGRGQSVNKGKKGGQSHKTQKPEADQSQRCFKCNRFGHFARDACCSARDKECEKCGTRGHFAVCCWKKGAMKPLPSGNQGSYQARNRKAYHVAEGATGPEDGYAFVVGGQQEAGEITLKVGGVELENVLIDSGASCNLIDYGTWNNLKQKHIKCESKVSDKKLFAYGQKEPMEVVGTFVAEIACEASGEGCVDEFTVIKSTGKPLLGRSTAEKLKVL